MIQNTSALCSTPSLTDRETAKPKSSYVKLPLSSTTALASTPSLTDPGTAETKSFSFSRSPNAFLLRYLSPVQTAIIVDASFYLKRLKTLYGTLSPQSAAKLLHRQALSHLNDERGQRIARLYRIFVYDAPPATLKLHTPIGRKALHLGKTKIAVWRTAFLNELRGLRKVALRLGEVPTTCINWRLKPEVLQALLKKQKIWDDISDDDFVLDLKQKGVDMRLGLDIASLAYKKQVQQIVLISGDADFVPAAKLARREGIDFILDPMWAAIRPDLYEHIDGLKTMCPKPGRKHVEEMLEHAE